MTKNNQAPFIECQWRIDRALHELRGNFPVLLVDASEQTKGWLVLSAEYYLTPESPPLIVFPPGEAQLVLTGIRAERLGLSESNAGDVSLPFKQVVDAGESARLIDPTLELEHGMAAMGAETRAALQAQLQPANATESAAIVLAKLAGLLPAVLVAPVEAEDISLWAREHHLSEVPVADITHYQQGLAVGLRQVSAASVPLEWAEDARVLAFRPRYGAVEHLAVLVGTPEKTEAPLVRVHSSCVTGDILGSQRCDCGAQLHGALQEMSKAGAGILLYMQQEGRGIGIANKLRAYLLQDAGLDTLDANHEIGFAGDERQFAEAAEILKQLGVTQIRLMSNNPLKISALEKLGIKILAREPLSIPPNAHNEKYLDTKRKRFGHLL